MFLFHVTIIIGVIMKIIRITDFKVIMTLILSLIVSLTYAVWLDSEPFRLYQPDGTPLDVLLSGDFLYNWHHDSRGYTIVLDRETGYWCWAIDENGFIISSGLPIHLNPIDEVIRSFDIRPNLTLSLEKYYELREAWEMSIAGSAAPSHGVIQNITIFIRFRDQTEFPQTIAHWDQLLNDRTQGANSMFNYFWNISNETLEVESPFFPISHNNMVLSYWHHRERRFYLPSSATNPDGYDSIAERDRNLHDLLANAVKAVEEQIPTNLLLNTGNPNNVDNVNFIIRGQTNHGALIWPHRWVLTHAHATIHGLRVWNYNVNIEQFPRQGVAVYAHEFAHTLGFPDFYVYAGYTNITPVGGWCLMSNDREPPQSISAAAIDRYTNWFQDRLPRITSNQRLTLHPLSTHGIQGAVRLDPATNPANEYFVIEFRNNSVSLIDRSLPSSGIFIKRVNPNINTGNRHGPPHEVYYFRPNGTHNTTGLINNAHFSANSGRTLFSSTTNPFPFWLNGNRVNQIVIYDISEIGETMSFSVHLGGANINQISDSF